jgi:aspartyl-tRNA(Asn)/glutamyl-tRNA(Gln) amidotransferase subunit A
MELLELNISDVFSLFQAKDLSVTELTKTILDQITRINPILNCYQTVLTESALQQAEIAQKQYEKNKKVRPLMGIPISLKDLFETKGIPTKAGSLIYKDYIPSKNGYVVNRLLEAGSVLLGKTTMHEIALGVTNVNPHYGACHNPWDINKISGGSSGGSAAALASGLCLGSLGTDTGGSIRIPAALCGVVGMKPTYGRVSLNGVLPLSRNLDHVCPMARNVRDISVLLQMISGYDGEDPLSVDHHEEDFCGNLAGDIKGWRIAIAGDDYFRNVDDEIDLKYQNAINGFKELGARVDWIDFPEGMEAAQANSMIIVCDAAYIYREQLKKEYHLFGSDVLLRLKAGRDALAVEYAEARQAQIQIRYRFINLFKKYNLLLTPTTPVTAPEIVGSNAIEQARLLTRFTAPFNLTGLPAITIPCGLSTNGLPIGMQVVSAPWCEAQILRAAYCFEQEIYRIPKYPAFKS